MCFLTKLRSSVLACVFTQKLMQVNTHNTQQDSNIHNFQKTCIQRSWEHFTGYNRVKEKVEIFLGFLGFWNSNVERIMEHSFKNNHFSFVALFDKTIIFLHFFQNSFINNFSFYHFYYFVGEILTLTFNFSTILALAPSFFLR